MEALCVNAALTAVIRGRADTVERRGQGETIGVGGLSFRTCYGAVRLNLIVSRRYNLTHKMLETCADTSVSWHNDVKEATITLAERNALVEQMLPVGETIVGMILRSGERPFIDRNELQAQANLAVVRAVDAYKPGCGIALNKRVAREVKKTLVRRLEREKKHWFNRIRIEDVLYPIDAD